MYFIQHCFICRQCATHIPLCRRMLELVRLWYWQWNALTTRLYLMHCFLQIWRMGHQNIRLFIPISKLQCCGSGIGCLFDPWIRDPGWEKVSIRIRDEQPGSYFTVYILETIFLLFSGLKNLNSLMRIRDEDSSDPGWKKSRIRDKHPGSATLQNCTVYLTFIKSASKNCKKISSQNM